MTDDDRPIKTPFRQWQRDVTVRFGPVLVWGCALIACTWLLFDRAMQVEFIPLEQNSNLRVAALDGTPDHSGDREEPSDEEPSQPGRRPETCLAAGDDRLDSSAVGCRAGAK